MKIIKNIGEFSLISVLTVLVFSLAVSCGVEPPKDMPEYKVLSKTKLISGDYHAEILIESFTKQTPAETFKAVADYIVMTKGFDEIVFYRTIAAKKANSSSKFLKKHPRALKDGYLGSYKDYEFKPSTY